MIPRDGGVKGGCKTAEGEKTQQFKEDDPDR